MSNVQQPILPNVPGMAVVNVWVLRREVTQGLQLVSVSAKMMVPPFPHCRGCLHLPTLALIERSSDIVSRSFAVYSGALDEIDVKVKGVDVCTAMDDGKGNVLA